MVCFDNIGDLDTHTHQKKKKMVWVDLSSLMGQEAIWEGLIRGRTVFPVNVFLFSFFT